MKLKLLPPPPLLIALASLHHATVDAFLAPVSFPTHTTLQTCVRMSDDGGGDDFYADYDPSAYGTSNNNNRYDSSRSPRDTNSRGGYDNSRNNNNSGNRGGGNRGYGNAPYSRDTSRDNSNVDERAVMQLIAQRTDARRSGDFPAADAIRERLMSEFQVGVDDPGGTWRTGVSSSGSGRKFIGGRGGGRDDDRGRSRSRDDYGGGGGGRGGRGTVGGRGRGGRGRGGRGGRGGRDLGPNGHDYHPSADQGPNTSPYTEIEIHRLIAQRLQAKFARNFQEADGIQDTLAEGGVYIHDKRKEWRADGVHIVNSVSTYGKSPYSEDESGNDDDALISKLVDERQKCKMMRQYDKADTIRDGLLDRHNVVVDDRAKQWSVGGDFGPEANEQRDAFNEFAHRDYLQSKSSATATMSNEDIDHIQEQVNVRVQAKKDRDFATADEIRDVLSNEYDVTILDKHKLWSVGGIFEETGQKPPGVYVRVGDDRRDPNGFKSPLSQEDEDEIMKMIATRYKAKRARDFDTSDGIRDELVERFGVRIDDKSNEWRIMSRHGGGGDDYARVGEHNLSDRDVEVVDAKLKERSACKRDREYEEADAIRDLLMDRFGVLVDDRNKEWSVLPGSVDDFVGGDDDDETASAAAEGQEADEDDGDEDTNQEEVEEEVEDIPTEETLAKLTIPLLKEKLREAGLPVSGKKAELVARLLA